MAYGYECGDSEVDPDGRHLRIELLDTPQEGYWRVPLPPKLQEQPATP